MEAHLDTWSTRPWRTAVQAQITPPGSKSLSNRALVLAALAQGPSVLSNILLADDTRVMLQGLGQLGFSPQVDEANKTVQMEGGGGHIPAPQAELFCGNSGTTIRFLAALCSLGHGVYTLDGVQRMRARPIGELGTMLRHLGTPVSYPSKENYPPLRLDADGLPGGILHVGQTASSQFLSAIVMAAPYARHELRVELEGPQTSWPYVAMTLRLMDEFGITAELYRDPETAQPRRLHVPQGVYRGGEYSIEPDASSAGYFLALAAIHRGSRITIGGLGRDSLQGDVQFIKLLEQMGAHGQITNHCLSVWSSEPLRAIEADMADMPDMAQTLAVVALFAKGTTLLTGLKTLKVKETDRLAALAAELTKLGAIVQATEHSLQITPPAKLSPASIATYDDHRMAMSFALVATAVQGVVIENPQCVNKTYPDFWRDLQYVAAATNP